MAISSAIEWTDTTWNPISGCTKISPGCRFCYAERMAIRLQAMKQPNYINGFQLTLHDNWLDLPLTWKKPRTIFVNSMSDLFHERIPDDFIKKIFDTMNKAWWHNFQILTKRSQRLRNMSDKLEWSENIWIGVSIETEEFLYRIKDLVQVNAHIKFISFEPLLGPISNLDLRGIDWVIAGGESGPKARPIEESWVSYIKNECLKKDVPFFFKQWGGRNKRNSGRYLEGRIWNQMPV